MRGTIDRFGRYRERQARAATVWLVLTGLALLLAACLLVSCAEPPQPAWRVTLDSLYARQQAGTLAATDTGAWRLEYHRRLAVMEGWR